MQDQIYDLEGLGRAYAGKRYRKSFAIYAFDFSDQIAAGALVTKNLRIEQDAAGGFVIDRIAASMRIQSAIGTVPIGSPLPRKLFASADDTDYVPTLELVEASLSTNGVPYTQSGRVPLTHFTSDGEAPDYLPTRIHVGGGQTIQIELFNGTTIPLKGKVSLIGFKLYETDAPRRVRRSDDE